MPKTEGTSGKMPHPVATFLKSSTSSLEIQVSNLKRTAAIATRKRVSPRRPGRRPPRYETVPSTYVSSTEIDPGASHALSSSRPVGTMTETWRPTSLSSEIRRDQPQHHHRRISFPSLHLGRSSKESQSHPHATLAWNLESPPVVFYGDADNSSGALVSGQLLLNVTKEDGLDMESVHASLSIHVSQKKPFTTHCHECASQVTELHSWPLVERPLLMAKGEHTFPFSVLLEGHNPTTMDGPLNSVSYHFKAEAVPRKTAGSPAPPTIKFEKVIDVKRSLPLPSLPHHSVRVFPPTNIKATVYYPQVIHPIGTNTLSLRLDGLAKQNEKSNMIEYWKLTKLSWRIEETAKTLAPACKKHSVSGLPPDQQQPVPAPKSIQRSDTRIIGEKTMFSGWKSNYSAVSDSVVEMELDYQLSRNARFTCNTRSPIGSQVTHQLMVEMVVSQEIAPPGRPSRSTPTGIGRILRMQFSTLLTERAGIGISWDNESPPIYQDVPPSPPAYSPGIIGNIDVGNRPIEETMEHLDGVVANGSVHRHSAEVTTGQEPPGEAPR